MTTYHLKFWSKACGTVEIERVYINADDRSSLGFFEMRTSLAARGTGNSYDAHRAAKGDAIIETGRVYSTTLTNEVIEKIMLSAAIAVHIEISKSSDDFSKFDALRAHCRDLKIICRADQKKAALARQKFTIEI